MALDSAPKLLDGRYEVGPEIGRGAMGSVRRGRDRRLGRDVAVKFLRGDLAADGRARTRFKEEAQAAARITHPNAVTILDTGEQDGVVYIVMECLTGRTLADELAGGPLAPGRVRQIAVDVLGALGVAHDLGIVHRDVKPANILLAVDGTAKVADFGIAKTAEGIDLTLTGQIMGTLAYMAPERLAGAPATPASDLYSLGVVLYEALTGERPFTGDTPAAVMHAAAIIDPRPVQSVAPEVDHAIAAAVSRALSKDPVHRFQRAAEFADALATMPPEAPAHGVATVALDGRTATVVGPPAVTEPGGRGADTEILVPHQRPPVRLPGRLLALGLVLVIVVVVLVARNLDDGGGLPSTTSAPSTTEPVVSPLPPPLDDAIKELEEIVNP